MSIPETYENSDENCGAGACSDAGSGSRVNSTDTPVAERIEHDPREGESWTAVDAGP